MWNFWNSVSRKLWFSAPITSQHDMNGSCRLGMSKQSLCSDTHFDNDTAGSRDPTFLVTDHWNIASHRSTNIHGNVNHTPNHHKISKRPTIFDCLSYVLFLPQVLYHVTCIFHDYCLVYFDLTVWYVIVVNHQFMIIILRITNILWLWLTKNWLGYHSIFIQDHVSCSVLPMLWWSTYLFNDKLLRLAMKTIKWCE